MKQGWLTLWTADCLSWPTTRPSPTSSGCSGTATASSRRHRFLKQSAWSMKRCTAGAMGRKEQLGTGRGPRNLASGEGVVWWKWRSGWRIQYFRDQWSERVLPGYIPTTTGACQRYWHAKYLSL